MLCESNEEVKNVIESHYRNRFNKTDKQCWQIFAIQTFHFHVSIKQEMANAMIIAEHFKPHNEQKY